MAVYRVLVGLDEILDTRFGTLCKIDREVAKEIIQDDTYIDRLTDNFNELDSRVDLPTYKKLHLTRNEETLSFSLMTDIPLLVGIGLKDLSHMYDRGVLEGNMEVVVNVWPYQLPVEAYRLFEAALDSFVPNQCDIKVINESYYGLTPEVLNSQYREWYCYDIEPWLAIHQNSLMETPVTDTSIHIAKISTSGKLPETVEGVGDAFKARELILKQWLNISYLDVNAFSVNVDFRKRRNFNI